MATNLVPKSSEKYFCEICDFNCSRKSQYDRHLMTRKHQMATNSNKFSSENIFVKYMTLIVVGKVNITDI